MKFKTTEEPKEFVPFDLILTVENLHDLKYLTALFNEDEYELANKADEDVIFDAEQVDSQAYKIWKYLRTKL